MISSREKSEQKRQQGRLKLVLDGQYRYVDNEDWLPCSLYDISPNGVALGGKESFYIGDKIELRFVLDKRTVIAQVEITNLIGRKAGGRITKMAAADTAFLQELFNREMLSGKSHL